MNNMRWKGQFISFILFFAIALPTVAQELQWNFSLEVKDAQGQSVNTDYFVRQVGETSGIMKGTTGFLGKIFLQLPNGNYEVLLGQGRMTISDIEITPGAKVERSVIYTPASPIARDTSSNNQSNRNLITPHADPEDRPIPLEIPRRIKLYAMWITLVVVLVILLLISIRQVNQWQRGVKFMFGKYHSVSHPGWRLVFPIIQKMHKVDMRLKTVDVPSQDAITKDNVSAKINAVIYYKVTDAAKAIIDVQNIDYAVLQLAQTSMRNIAGSVTLDELLAERQQIAEQIEKIVDQATTHWGVDVTAVELKDIELPENMVRTIAKQAEAERERRAVIINAEGEVIAAHNLAKAAEILSAKPGALHLRTLNSINDISSDQSNTVIFTVPLEVMQAFTGYTKKLSGNGGAK